MTTLDYALLALLSGIILMTFAFLWQMYVVLSEIHTLDKYQNNPKMAWIAAAFFFSFSLAIYYFCPNARKKGMILLLLGILGVVCYGAGMWLKRSI